jgi:hypothetical protein
MTSLPDPSKNLNTNTNEQKSVTSKHTKLTLRTVEERNPYQFIEKALNQAKEKLAKMQNTKNFVESLTDNEKKKKYLKSENK